MKSFRTFFILAMFILLATEAVFSKVPQFLSDVPLCDSQSDAVVSGLKVDLADLPHVLLVGREAHLLIQAQDRNGKKSEIKVTQNFLKPESKLLCATGNSEALLPQHFEMGAPILLDLTEHKVTGNSVWSFKVMLSNLKVGIWNQASHLLSQNFHVESLNVAGNSISVYQISHDQFEIVYRKKTEGQLQTLSVLYDEAH